MNIRLNVSRLLTELPAQVCLVAVTKSATLTGIEEVIRCGVKDLAFSNDTQLAAINKLILKDFRRHYIGHIQTNKARRILAEKPFLIQSVDSWRLAKKMNSICKDLNIQQDMLLQVKTDKDKEHGFQPDEVLEIATKIETELKNLRIKGLMTVPPQVEEQELIVIFTGMKNLYNDCEKTLNRKLNFLSMGMSQDFRTAVKCGSNMVRLGTRIFS